MAAVAEKHLDAGLQSWFVEKQLKEVVAANADWVPPYESGATLYVRPFPHRLGTWWGFSPADEYLFGIYISCRCLLQGWLSASNNFVVSVMTVQRHKGRGLLR